MNIIEEFTNITNKQAYERAFTRRFMLTTSAISDEIFLGNTQRADFLSLLTQCLKQLPPEPYIFDVGAGGGEVVDFAISQLPSATISIEEPNEILLAKYQDRIQQYANLFLDEIFPQPIQDLYLKSHLIAQQDLVLSLHMIYHLTDFTVKNPAPEQDLINAIQFMYSMLKPGGKIFLVYADLAAAVVGKATIAYYQQTNPAYAKNLERIYTARNELINKGGILQSLITLEPAYHPTLQSTYQSSYLFGNSIEDIGAMCLIGELVAATDEIFDLNILKFCLNFVKEHPAEIGLCREERDVLQRGMYRCDEPQVVCVIEKNLK